MSPRVFLLVFVVLPVEPFCGPVEEGKQMTLACNVDAAGCPQANPILEWKNSGLIRGIQCDYKGCDNTKYPQYISTAIVSTGSSRYFSTLTINNVSRTVPFNMESKWECESCNGATVTICDPLQIFGSPVVTFNKNKRKTTFNKGDSVSFACFAQGNPDPTMTLTREGTDLPLKGPQTTTLTHTLDSLDCLDTGVYVCSSRNNRGRNSKNIFVNVRCPQQFLQVFKPQPVIDAEMGSTARIDLEVYGFPEPTSLTLKLFNGTDVTSGRHKVHYTTGYAPLGIVTVTIFDIVESDYNTYTLSVDNGVGAALSYTFSLKKAIAKKEEDTTAIIIAVIAVIVVASLVVFIIFTLRRYKNLKTATATGLYLTPIETPDIVHNVAALEAPRPGQYEDVDCVGDIANLTPNTAGLALGSGRIRDASSMLPAPHTAMVSASQRPGETIPVNVIMTPPSGPYNFTSPQDVEPPAIYNRAVRESPSITNVTSPGTYNNVLTQSAGIHDSASPSAGTPMTSLHIAGYNKPVLTRLVTHKCKQYYQNVKFFLDL